MPEISTWPHNRIGQYGEKVAAEYLKRQGFQIVATNVARSTGEIDIIAKRKGALHFVEVKTNAVHELPVPGNTKDSYDPSANLHAAKIRRVVRTSEWYVAEHGYEGEWQVDCGYGTVLLTCPTSHKFYKSGRMQRKVNASRSAKPFTGCMGFLHPYTHSFRRNHIHRRICFFSTRGVVYR